MTLHNLILKFDSPITLLRSLDAPRLCTGTKLCVKLLVPHIIEATILTGYGKSKDVCILRISTAPTDMPFEFKPLQFPVRLGFVVSINETQGQSLKITGIDLETSRFSRGQLYVVCSRAGTNILLCLIQKLGHRTSNNFTIKLYSIGVSF